MNYTDFYDFAGDYQELINKYDELINEYQGIAISHRGMCDYIKHIVICISSSLYRNNPNTNKQLIDAFSCYRFIKSIVIDGNSCSIDFYDDGVLKNIKFSCIFFDDEYKKMCYTTEELIENGASVKKIKMLSGRYKYAGNCHFASLKFLEKFKDRNFKAITSICNSVQGVSFFHSYIWDCDSNLIYDLSRNIVMDKDCFDYLFTIFEIVSLSYNDYLCCSNVIDNDYFQKLFFISLKKLSDDSKRDFYRKIGHI